MLRTCCLLLFLMASFQPGYSNRTSPMPQLGEVSAAVETMAPVDWDSRGTEQSLLWRCVLPQPPKMKMIRKLLHLQSVRLTHRANFYRQHPKAYYAVRNRADRLFTSSSNPLTQLHPSHERIV